MAKKFDLIWFDLISEVLTTQSLLQTSPEYVTDQTEVLTTR